MIVLGACASTDPSAWVEHNDRIAFRNANVVQAERNDVLRGQTVYVAEGRIAWVGPAGEKRLPAGTSVIDAQGAYLLPGLGDMHVHHYPQYDDEDLLLYLANGVTTVRIMDGSDRDLETKQRLAAGELIGPRYYSCGPRLTYAKRARDVEEATSSVVAIAESGFDCVKVYALRGNEDTFRASSTWRTL